MPKPRPLAVPQRHPAEAPEANTPDLLDQIRHETPTGTRALVSIHQHPNPSRTLDPRHVLDLARSIAALGLIHPLVIDIEDVVIAGSHRYAALAVLATPHADRYGKLVELVPAAAGIEWQTDALDFPGAEQLDFHRIPVRVLPLSQRTQPDEAWRAEVAENERRRDYSPKEVKGLALKLLEQGYKMQKGRNVHAPRALPVIAALIGRSERQVKRLLAQAENPDAEPKKHNGPNVPIWETAGKLKVRIEEFKKKHHKEITGPEHRALEVALKVFERLARK
jgi:ParB family chromosome partitioning protein